ncbi:MAG: response regulator, partial [Gemmatimonadetes bacterium]|nr:response regulator [Gemmatimonadota bacterium]
MSEAKILVTDDEEDIREVVADRLSHWGYDVIEAVDGVDCLEKLETFDADLLVLDLRMPRMDGLTV